MIYMAYCTNSSASSRGRLLPSSRADRSGPIEHLAHGAEQETAQAQVLIQAGPFDASAIRQQLVLVQLGLAGFCQALEAIQGELQAAFVEHDQQEVRILDGMHGGNANALFADHRAHGILYLWLSVAHRSKCSFHAFTMRLLFSFTSSSARRISCTFMRPLSSASTTVGSSQYLTNHHPCAHVHARVRCSRC